MQCEKEINLGTTCYGGNNPTPANFTQRPAIHSTWCEAYETFWMSTGVAPVIIGARNYASKPIMKDLYELKKTM